MFDGFDTTSALTCFASIPAEVKLLHDFEFAAFIGVASVPQGRQAHIMLG